MKNSLLFTALLLSVIASKAATFTSTAIGGDWNSPSTWTYTGTDADSIPDIDDVVTITTGSVVTVSVDNQFVNLLNVNSGGTLTFSGVDVFTINATTTLNGTINGTFSGINHNLKIAGQTITGSGTMTITGDILFTYNGLIDQNVIINNIGNIILGNNGVSGYRLLNKGTVTLDGTINGTLASCYVANFTSGIISVTNAMMTIGTCYLTGGSYTNNTVIFDGTSSYTINQGDFENLIIRGTGTKTLTSSKTTNILKNLTIEANSSMTQAPAKQFQVNGTFINSGTVNGTWNLFYINGNLVNGGTFNFHPSQSVTFRGLSAQTISGTAPITIPFLVINNSSGVTKSSIDLTVTKTLTLTAGNFNNDSGILSLGLPVVTSAGTLTANNPGNTVVVTYSTGFLPNTTSGYYDLTLAGTVNGSKTLASNTTIINNLTINNTNFLSTNNFNLSIGGNLTINTTGQLISSTNKSVTFNGLSSTQFIDAASPSVYTTFTNLVIDNPNGVAINSGLYKLSEVLTINSGYFDTGNNTFIMTSTATKTARIAPVTGDIYGNFIVERYINARDTTWSCFASPVQFTTIQDWDNEIFMYLTTDVNQATVFSYDETVADYVAVPDGTTSVSSMQGFEVYLAADPSLNNISNVTLNSVGNLTYGDLGVFLSYTSGTGYEGQNLVGNPFASSISWTDVYNASNDIENFADVFDYTTGNYANVNLGDEIGLGQGFWVYAQNTNGFLQILESAKTTSSNSSLRLNKPMVPALTLASADGSHSFSHRLELVSDQNAINGKDALDRPYRKSPERRAPKITCNIDGKECIRNTFSSENNSYSIPLDIKVGIAGKYTISASDFDLIKSDYPCIMLEDKSLNKFIDLNTTDSYTFLASLSNTKERFELHFSKNGNCKSMNSDLVGGNLEDQVLILPTMNGNSITFNFSETLNSTVSVTNTLGQAIVEQFNIQANTQTIELGIPTDFSGMYIITISNEQGVVSKKFVKK